MKVKYAMGVTRTEHRRTRRTGCCIGLLAGLALPNCGDRIHPSNDGQLLVKDRLSEQIGGAGPASKPVISEAGTVSLASGAPTNGQAGAAGSPAASPLVEEPRADPPRASRIARINEVKIDPPGTDAGFEFIEISGEPNTSLDHHWLITIEGDSESNPGQIDTVIDLSKCNDGPCILDSNGLMLLSSDPQSAALIAGAAWRKTNEISKGGLENGTTSLWLMVAPTSLQSGQDLDVDDDGVLESQNEVTLRDSVAWTDGDASDYAYSDSILGPKPKVQAAVACVDADGVRTWQYGQLLGESQSITLDVAHCVPAGLESFVLSPAAMNDCASEPPSQPTPDGIDSAGAAGFTGLTLVAAGGTETSISTSGGSGATSVNLSTATAAGTAKGGSASAVATGGATHYSVGPGGGAVGSGFGGRGGASGGTADNLRQYSTVSTPMGGVAAAWNSTAGFGAQQVTVIVAESDGQSGRSGWWSPAPVPASSGSPSLHRTSNANGSATASSPKTDPTSPPHMPSGCTVKDGPTDPTSPIGALVLLLFLADFARHSLSHRRPSLRFANRS